MIDYNPREMFEKDTGMMFLYNHENYYKYLEQRNKELVEEMIYDLNNIGGWLSAALSDDSACKEFKNCINEWAERKLALIGKNTGKTFEELTKGAD